jgi:hypothetical protein
LASIEQLKTKTSNPEGVLFNLGRDAWLPNGRLSIDESHLGCTPIKLSELRTDTWKNTVNEGLKCLNAEKEYRGRVKQIVTHKTDGRKTEKPVTPHLHISTVLENESSNETMLEKGFTLLQPAYDWVRELAVTKS